MARKFQILSRAYSPFDPEEENSGPLRNRHEKSQATNDHLGTASDRDIVDGGGGAEGLDLTTVYDRWLVKLGLKSTETRTKYRYHVDRFLGGLGHKNPTRITDDDVQKYLNMLPGRPSRVAARAAITGFLKMANRTIGEVDVGAEIEPRIIIPLTDAEFEQMVMLAKTARDVALLRVLRDTGGRGSAICAITLSDFKGDHVVLTAPNAKNKIASFAPLSKETIAVLEGYIEADRPVRFLFEVRPGEPINRRVLWRLVNRLGKRARIGRPVYPHLFRHMKALEFRRAKAQDDTVLNALGWKDLKFYAKRYGRRPATETMAEARAVFDGPKKVSMDNTEAIAKLATLLAEGKIDLPTYQASIVALTQRNELKVEVPGYR
jgi:integrase